MKCACFFLIQIFRDKKVIYIHNFHSLMDQEILGLEEQFEECVQNQTLSPQEHSFNQAVMVIQEVILDEDFQTTQTHFMKNNCYSCDSSILPIFLERRALIQKMLENKVGSKIPLFKLSAFAQALSSKQHSIDEEIYQIIMSCYDIEVFKSCLADYKISHDEEERYRILTVKTTKVPENKKVKGNSENIFGNSNLPNFGVSGYAKNGVKKMQSSKNQDECLVAEKVLTIRSLKKC